MAALAGFADRNKALSDLSATNDNSTAAAVLFITLLFITFECMPVLVKLIAARGPYDEDVNTVERLRIGEFEKEREATGRIRNATRETYVEAETDKQNAIIRGKDRKSTRLNSSH